MKKITESTHGASIYMKMELDGKIEEISVYIRDNGFTYKTSGDSDHAKREKIINAFNELY